MKLQGVKVQQMVLFLSISSMIKMKLNNFIVEHNIWLHNNEEGTQIDLNNIKFSNELIQSKSLQSSIFEKSVFQGMIFENCDLTGSSFFNCVFKKCEFHEILLHKCEFQTCCFENTTFENTQLTKSDFNGCTLPYSKFSGCNLDWSFINNSDLREVYFNNVSLEGAIIVDCKLYNTNKNKINFGKKFTPKISDIDFSLNGDNSKIIQKEELLKLLKIGIDLLIY